MAIANKKAQIALIVVMIIATVLTLVLSVSFQLVTDTQVTKLEEENQKALAAAEAAVEASIKENATTIIGQGSLNNITGFTGGATVTSIVDNVFTSSKITKDDLYAFYLADYDPGTKTLGSTSLQQDVTVCFQSATTNPALEITLLKTNMIKKYVVDPDARITNASSPSTICSGDSSFGYSYTIPAADIGTNTRLVLVKVLFNSSKLFFSRTADFPLQGKTATSEVVSQTGVSKKITLFQSYPQIPADFFDTTF